MQTDLPVSPRLPRFKARERGRDREGGIAFCLNVQLSWRKALKGVAKRPESEEK